MRPTKKCVFVKSNDKNNEQYAAAAAAAVTRRVQSNCQKLWRFDESDTISCLPN